MHATVTKAPAQAENVQTETAARKTAVIQESLQQIPLWADTSVRAIQFSLKVNTPGDKYEQEADRVAGQVMRISETTVQRKTCACGRAAGPDGMCADCKRKRLGIQRKATGGEGQTTAPPIVNQVLQQRGGSLDLGTRNFMESRFGQDFSQVRVHNDSQADQAARSVNAKAFTVGRNIVFGSSEYAPESMRGKFLLAHELTHVLQQTGTDAVLRKPVKLGLVNDATERGTIRNTSYPDSGIPPTLNAPPLSLQRYHHDSSCTKTDLTGVVWPGDHVMRQMVAKAIRVLGATPIDPLVTALFPKYFRTATPPVATILAVFNAVQSVISADDYTYECEHDCGPDEAAYVRDRLRYIGIDPNLHLCLNHMSGYPLDCNGSLILHEMTHYASHLDDENECKGACSTAGCPASLSASDALDNTYSYANFALELYPLSV